MAGFEAWAAANLAAIQTSLNADSTAILKAVGDVTPQMLN